MDSMEVVHRSDRHMATDVNITIYCDSKDAAMARKAMDASFSRMHFLEKKISEFHPESPVYQLNRSRCKSTVAISEELHELLLLSFGLRKKTNSGFDPLCKSRGDGTVEWTKHAFSRTTEDVILGFGAIGKGFILDKIRLEISSMGFQNFVLNAGGSSIVLSGFRENQLPLDWAWSWQKDNEGLSGKKFLHMNGKLIALGVSGTMEQGFHILNPERKQARENLSALVAHPSAAVADALSTALFVNGWDGMESLQDPMHKMPMALIDKELNLYWNGDFREFWGDPDSS